VLDAKYKSIDEGLMYHPDAYQMLAYCTAYGLPRGYLVYARDSGAESRTHTVRRSGQEIVVFAVDVEKEPEELLADVRALADRVALDALVVAPRAA
jgi:5-methylcytosine-specific restriction enzyme subunit McrC